MAWHVPAIGGGTLPIGFFTTPYELSVATTYWGSIPELIEVIALARAVAGASAHTSTITNVNRFIQPRF